MQKEQSKLAFLGDAQLDGLVAERLFTDFPSLDVGEYTTMKSFIVMNLTLNDFFAANDLDSLAKGSSAAGADGLVPISSEGKARANVVEALIGSLWTDNVGLACDLIEEIYRFGLIQLAKSKRDFTEIIQHALVTVSYLHLVLAHKTVASPSKSARRHHSSPSCLPKLSLLGAQKKSSAPSKAPSEAKVSPSKSTPKPAALTVPKAKAEVEAKAKAKAQAEAKAKAKAEAKAKADADAKAKAKTETKAKTMVKVQVEPKVEAKVKAKAAVTTATATKAKPQPQAKPQVATPKNKKKASKNPVIATRPSSAIQQPIAVSC